MDSNCYSSKTFYSLNLIDDGLDEGKWEFHVLKVGDLISSWEISSKVQIDKYTHVWAIKL